MQLSRLLSLSTKACRDRSSVAYFYPYQLSKLLAEKTGIDSKEKGLLHLWNRSLHQVILSLSFLLNQLPAAYLQPDLFSLYIQVVGAELGALLLGPQLVKLCRRWHAVKVFFPDGIVCCAKQRAVAFLLLPSGQSHSRSRHLGLLSVRSVNARTV